MLEECSRTGLVDFDEAEAQDEIMWTWAASHTCRVLHSVLALSNILKLQQNGSTHVDQIDH